MGELDFWKGLLKIRTLLTKEKKPSFLQLREDDPKDFDKKMQNLALLTKTKLTEIDQDIFQKLIQRILIDNLTKELQTTNPGILHASTTDIKEENIASTENT